MNDKDREILSKASINRLDEMIAIIEEVDNTLEDLETNGVFLTEEQIATYWRNKTEAFPLVKDLLNKRGD